jgi:hypothetical protein
MVAWLVELPALNPEAALRVNAASGLCPSSRWHRPGHDLFDVMHQAMLLPLR